jgi:hypothetical protein
MLPRVTRRDGLLANQSTKASPEVAAGRTATLTPILRLGDETATTTGPPEASDKESALVGAYLQG